MKRILKKLLLLFILTAFGCSSSDDSETTPDPDTNPLPNKTTTYEGDIKAIVDVHCIECHSNPPTQGAPFSMETYQEVVNTMNNRDFILRVTSTSPINVMPPAGRLPQETIDLILDWEADGLLER